MTLEKIRDETEIGNSGFSSEQIAERMGISRTTARRYLEFLVREGILAVDVSYGGVGRPERRYQIRGKD